MMSWNRKMMRARSLGVHCAHRFWARRAVSKAISTSSVVLMGISASGSSVNGETEVSLSARAEATTCVIRLFTSIPATCAGSLSAAIVIFHSVNRYAP